MQVLLNILLKRWQFVSELDNVRWILKHPSDSESIFRFSKRSSDFSKARRLRLRNQLFFVFGNYF